MSNNQMSHNKEVPLSEQPLLLEKHKFENHIEKLKERFSSCKTAADRYELIIALGKQAQRLDEAEKTKENIVPGCQSLTYMCSLLEERCLYFRVSSEALISAGLAQLLIMAYNGLSPEAVLTFAPDFLDQLQVSSSITPSRVNGLYSIHLRMKQHALQQIAKNQIK